jgi:transcription antitermination factor NusG
MERLLSRRKFVMMQWFAVYVLTRHEKVVASMLETKGYKVCLPLIRTKRAWCDRTKWLDLPAFPGYVFCEFESERRVPILSIPSVLNIVGAGRVPIPIPPQEVAELAILERVKCTAEPWPYVEAGQWARIVGGALDGLTGILVNCKKASRVVVSVSLLQRSVAIEVDREQVVPIPRRPTPNIGQIGLPVNAGDRSSRIGA